MSAAELAALRILLNGDAIDVQAGISVAAAILNANGAGFRTSVNGEVRAPLCGMGICYECRVTIDGIAHRRSCLVTVAGGMQIETDAGVTS